MRRKRKTSKALKKKTFNIKILSMKITMKHYLNCLFIETRQLGVKNNYQAHLSSGECETELH